MNKDLDQAKTNVSISAHEVADTSQISRPLLSRIVWLTIATLCAAMSARVVMRAKLSGVDFRFPMSRALDFFHARSQGLVYQTLFFSQHVKFQYPPTALLLLDLGRKIGVGTPLQYNIANAFVFYLSASFSLFVPAAKVFGRSDCSE